MVENNIKYVHTNLIAKDWRKLTDFYIKVLNCKPVLPERNLSGDWIDDMTGISNVRVSGMHLSLPGYDNGPTLEIFEYSPNSDKDDENYINRKGFGHLAFHVELVEKVLKDILEHGGEQLGKVVRKEYENIGVLTAVYATDPEGNFIEIQNWESKF